MGKYSMSRSAKNYRSSQRSGGLSSSFNDNGWNRFLYDASGIVGLGDLIRLVDSDRYMDDYLREKNLDWSDLKYPSLAKNAGNGSNGVYKTSIKALEKLYRL